MGEIFGAAGQVASAAISSAATKEATQMQIDALQRQRDFVYKELEPGKIGAEATAADILRAKNRLALQGIIDPKLLEARYKGQSMLLDQLKGIETGKGDELAQMAAESAAATSPKIAALKERLLDEAANYIEAGATLPPDVQAEVVKAGLEKSGMVSGAASVKGLGGNIVREMVGERALKLKDERIARAAALTKAGQDLENSRTQLLASVFPGLKALQTQNLQNTAAVESLANQMVPEAGLGGTDVANIWLARVGATNQLAQSAADAAARGAMRQGDIWGNAIGGAAGSLGRALPSTTSVYQSLFPTNTTYTTDIAGNPYTQQDMNDLMMAAGFLI